MLTDVIIGVIVCGILLTLGIWFLRRKSQTRFSRWLRFQSIACFALIPVVIATGLDTNDAFSADLGRLTGQSLVLFWIVTALFALFGKTGNSNHDA